MKYENTPYKLKRIWTQSRKNEYEIVRQEDKNKRIEKEVENYVDYSIVRKITDLSTEWEQVIFPEYVAAPERKETWRKSCRYQWDIDLKIFPTKRIPFIKYNVVYKCNDSKIIPIEGYVDKEADFIEADSLYLTYSRTSCIFRLEDVRNAEGKIIEGWNKVTMIVGTFLHFLPYFNLNKTYDLQAKLLIKIYNPEFHI